MESAPGQGEIGTHLAPSTVADPNRPTDLKNSISLKDLEDAVIVQGIRKFSISITLQYADLEFGEELGRGGFSAVYKGTYLGEPVAIKKLYLTANTLGDVTREIDIMRNLIHPNVVRFIGCTSPPDPIAIVTELMPRGSLAHLLETHDPCLTEQRKLEFALDIARGMAYLHSKDVIHSDLNPKNVLVNDDWSCKVSDFGLSLLNPGRSKSVTGAGQGTLIYAAPEVFRMERVSALIDVYSFGICLWEIWYPGKRPFGKIHHHAITFNVVTHGLRPDIDDADKPPYTNLMRNCWAASPGARPTFVEIVGKLEDIVGRSGRRKGQATASVDLPLALSHDLTLGDLIDRRIQGTSRDAINLAAAESKESKRSESLGSVVSVGSAATEAERSASISSAEAETVHDVTQTASQTASRTLPEDIRLWTIQECCDWATSKSMPWAVDYLTDNDISGKVLVTLDDHDLKTILDGLSFGRRRLFKVELQNLLKDVPEANPLSSSSSSIQTSPLVQRPSRARNAPPSELRPILSSTLEEDEQGAAAEMIDNVEASSFLEHGHALTMTVFAHNTTTCHVCASPLTEGDKGYRCAVCERACHETCRSALGDCPSYRLPSAYTSSAPCSPKTAPSGAPPLQQTTSAFDLTQGSLMDGGSREGPYNTSTSSLVDFANTSSGSSEAMGRKQSKKKSSILQNRLKGSLGSSFSSFVARLSTMRKRSRATAEESDNILGQILVALSFASSYFELGDCAECIRFAKKSINDIVAECNYLIKSTPAKITKMFETSDDAQLDRMVQAPDHFPYVIGPEYTWKDNLVVFAAVVRAKLLVALCAEADNEDPCTKAYILMGALRFFQNVESVAVEEVTRSEKLAASGPLTAAIISAGLKRQ